MKSSRPRRWRYTINLSALRDQASKFAGDPQQTRYTPADYLSTLNLAQNQFAMDSRALWKDISYSSVGNDATYALPTDFMFEDEVHFDGISLEPLSRRDLTTLSPKADWSIVTGTPTHYIVDPEEAQKMLLLYPIPTINDAQKTIVMRYFPLPTALAADTDIPFNTSLLMLQFHIALCAYSAWLLLASEETTPLMVQKRRDLLAIYSDATTKATDLFKNTASASWRMGGTRAG